MHNYWDRKARFYSKSTDGLKLNTEGDQIRLASLVEESIVDGPGMRFVLFTQGCPHRCPGCHNPHTHVSVGGTVFSLEEILALYKKNPAIRGITLSGGEPIAQAGPLSKIAQAVHQNGGDVIVYTGYRLEQLYAQAKTDDGITALMGQTDLLIDGPFVLDKRCLDVAFVGSLNQRLIALSSAGNALLNDIPVLAEGPTITRVFYNTRGR